MIRASLQAVANVTLAVLLAVLLAVMVIHTACPANAQEEETVKEYTNYEQAQRVVRVAVSECWEIIGRGHLMHKYAEPPTASYLDCTRRLIRDIQAKMLAGTWLDDPDTSIIEPIHH